VIPSSERDSLAGRFAFSERELKKKADAMLAFESFALGPEAWPAVDDKAVGPFPATVAEQPAPADLPTARLLAAPQVREQRWLYAFSSEVGLVAGGPALNDAGE
jgi:hypothetical protein